MKNQASFSSKDKNIKLKCRLLQFLFGALRINNRYIENTKKSNEISHAILSINLIETLLCEKTITKCSSEELMIYDKG